MKTYKWANNIVGWMVFTIAIATYLLTIEPTASFWDCGEFIASAFKLEVGHPPGNPIFMLVGNLFTQLTSELSQKALMINVMSATFSALTILFLFWTITHLTRKLLLPEGGETIKPRQLITILGAGAVGALAYTFSDTFWFSAVEGEVYAFSSLMTAVVFWLILKWEDLADEPYSNRWLILIAYLMGVSIAVHLLNLLCIPAIVLVYYFRKNPHSTLKGALWALLISFGLIAVILYGLVQGIMEVCGWFELLFVNGFGFSYNSGVAFYVVLIFGLLAWSIWETMRKNQHPARGKIAFLAVVFLLGIPFFGRNYILGALLTVALAIFLFQYKKITPVALNTLLVGLLVITIGYSSYALIMIRSSANTPMDQNSPEDIFTLRSYLSREQYGEVPLFYGQTFVSELKYNTDGTPAKTDKETIWTQIAKKNPSEKDKYDGSEKKKQYEYVDELNMLFPRMHSSDPRHIQVYKEWTNFEGRRVEVKTPQGNKWVQKPTFGENLKFFFSYQVNFMYWRYFMWNFSGRQNDIQGSGDLLNGNWITGIKFVDEKILGRGPQDDMPDSIAKNKGHNKYYMLPLLLGILGIFFQVFDKKKGVEQFWVTFLLFFMTGLAIVVYLNQTPNQPRERDYAYAASFYAFCIWIGLGTAGVIKGLNKNLKLPELPAAIGGVILCLLIPFQMASQNWDDHNRSKRYLTRDFGYNYLTTCEPNAIIFTNGDNDTFPLWYGQEVEGYRTDVRVCNLSYLQTDWYIDQMKRQAYESEPLPIDWQKYDYKQGKNEIAHIIPRTGDAWDIGRVLDWVKSEDKRTKQIRLQGGVQEVTHVRTQRIVIPVDTEKIAASGRLKPEDIARITGDIRINFGEMNDSLRERKIPAKSYLTKQEMMILDMLKNNSDWSRPIYYAITVGSDMYLRLDDYFRQDGIAYRIMPFQTFGEIDTEAMYTNLLKKYRWGNLEEPGLYLDENTSRMARTFRILFGSLARNLINERDTAKTKEVLDYCLKVIPSYNVPHDFYSSAPLAEAYNRIGEIEKATELYTDLAELITGNLNWYSRLTDRQYAGIFSEVHTDISELQSILLFFYHNNKELYEQYAPEFEQYYSRYEQFANRVQKMGGANR
ncbi:MAG: DUF2723 domain-containing protein [Dysgonamonadaceae bacterium]|jgi:hypothetical protein|nr:DUF2723 domain-containing protein [Dysgonamonadaceae bacterium]